MENYNALNQGHEFDWDDEIQEEGSSFVILPEGDYRFTVEKVERARHPGSAKLPPCNKAIVTFCVYGANGEQNLITKYYFLHSTLESMLSEFFSAIGLKGKDEKVKMCWKEAVGRSGVCKVYIENYHKKDDKPGENTGYSNKIKKLYPSYNQPEIEKPIQANQSYTPPAYQPPSYVQPQQSYPQPTQGTTWKSDKF